MKRRSFLLGLVGAVAAAPLVSRLFPKGGGNAAPIRGWSKSHGKMIVVQTKWHEDHLFEDYQRRWRCLYHEAPKEEVSYKGVKIDWDDDDPRLVIIDDPQPKPPILCGEETHRMIRQARLPGRSTIDPV